MPTHAIQIEPTEPAPMTPKQESIVSAAAKLFLERGYGSVSMDAIAAEASASKRTVYSYYHNKETLFADVMSMVCAEIGGRQACPLADEQQVAVMPPSVVMQNTGEYVLNILASMHATEMYRVVVAECGRFPELGKSYYETGPRWVIDRMSNYLDDLVATGDAEIEDTDLAARNFFGMIVFPVQMEMLLGVIESVSEQRIREITKAAVDIFCPAFKVSATRSTG